MNKWLIIFAILLTACTGTSEKSEECITIDLATVFDHQPQEVALKKWAKSIQFIPLQTNDSILIKYISRIIKHGDKLLVQHDNRASVFDLAGKYLYDIGKQGGGPDEFSRISGLEPHDHLIYIKDSPIRIKIYRRRNIHVFTKTPLIRRKSFLLIRGVCSTPPVPSGDFIPSLRRTLS